MPLSVVFTCDSTVYPVTSEWRAGRSPRAWGPVVQGEGAGRGEKPRKREHERGAGPGYDRSVFLRHRFIHMLYGLRKRADDHHQKSSESRMAEPPKALELPRPV
eukprot:scaffold89771_cov30-Phaeocystis_antarctica.AAC.2